jgi:GDP-4-dehydro-6-deoxy-D-mannose reductase
MILYNGSSGGVGRYLADALRAGGRPGVSLLSRLADRAGLRDELGAIDVRPGAPVWLVQLAARVSVSDCERDPAGAFATNVRDTTETVRAFLAWARSRGSVPHVLYTSTGHVYGRYEPGCRIREDAPVSPRSVYARTKLEAETALLRLAESDGATLCIARIFGLVGPSQPPHYVLPGLIRRVREDRLSDVPGLSYVRDYIDARDVCRILVELCGVEAESLPRVINVCTGDGVSLRTLVELIFAGLGRTPVPPLGEAPGRVDDLPWIVGDPGRLTRLLGGPPRQISLERTIRDALAL